MKNSNGAAGKLAERTLLGTAIAILAGYLVLAWTVLRKEGQADKGRK